MGTLKFGNPSCQKGVKVPRYLDTRLSLGFTLLQGEPVPGGPRPRRFGDDIAPTLSVYLLYSCCCSRRRSPRWVTGGPKTLTGAAVRTLPPRSIERALRARDPALRAGGPRGVPSSRGLSHSRLNPLTAAKPGCGRCYGPQPNMVRAPRKRGPGTEVTQGLASRTAAEPDWLVTCVVISPIEPRRWRKPAALPGVK